MFVLGGVVDKVSHLPRCFAVTLPETNIFLPLKMDGWNTILSYWGGLFSGAMLVSGRIDLSVFLLEIQEINYSALGKIFPYLEPN